MISHGSWNTATAAPKGHFWRVTPFTLNGRSGFTLELRKRKWLVWSEHVTDRMFWDDAPDSEVLEGATMMIQKVA